MREEWLIFFNDLFIIFICTYISFFRCPKYLGASININNISNKIFNSLKDYFYDSMLSIKNILNLHNISTFLKKFIYCVIFAICISLIIFLLFLIISPYLEVNEYLESILKKYLTFFHTIDKIPFSDSLTESTNINSDMNYGMNGDSFGVINPFIALLAAVLTFIAFWTQFQANKKMLEDNEKQQIERQFYEMLRIHQVNVEKMKIKYIDYDNNGNFALFDAEGHVFFKILRQEFDVIFNEVSSKDFCEAYKIFFYGRNLNQLSIIMQLQQPINCVPRNTIGKGHISQLDHYYRHLYYMVKSIACSTHFSEKEKKRLLKILRAQMTSDEQILLFYNWYSGLGEKWESRKHNQYFFSEYQMIHNIFPTNCIFGEKIIDKFPYVSKRARKKMFQHI